MWKKVAEYVSQHMTQPILDDAGNIYEVKITNHQCGERYKHHLDPNIQHRNTDPWTNEEVSAHMSLFPFAWIVIYNGVIALLCFALLRLIS